MEGVRLDDKRESFRRMVFEYNRGGVDNEKVILHYKRWDLYMRVK